MVEIARWLEFKVDLEDVNCSQMALVVKNSPADAGERLRFDPWVRKIPRRKG